jgi:hypothetical protein
MRIIKYLLFIGLLFLIIVIFFQGRDSGYSAIVGQYFKTCKCIGIPGKKGIGDVMVYTCRGIPVMCKETNGFSK